MLRMISLALTLVLFVSTMAVADGAGTSAADYLMLGQDARVLAMGGAGVAVPRGPQSVFTNPAGLADVQGIEYFAAHNAHVEDFAQEHAAVGFCFLGGGVGVGGSYIGSGDMQAYDPFGNPLDSYTASSMSVLLGYGRGDRFSWGAAVAYLGDSIDDSDEQAIYGNVGLTWALNTNLAVGASALHLGQDLGDDPLPRVYSAGVAFTKWSGVGVLDIVLPEPESVCVRAGLEWQVAGLLYLRAGYDGRRDAGDGLAAGLGFDVGGASIGYAFVPFGDLGQSHHVTLSGRF